MIWSICLLEQCIFFHYKNIRICIHILWINVAQSGPFHAFCRKKLLTWKSLLTCYKLKTYPYRNEEASLSLSLLRTYLEFAFLFNSWYTWLWYESQRRTKTQKILGKYSSIPPIFWQPNIYSASEVDNISHCSSILSFQTRFSKWNKEIELDWYRSGLWEALTASAHVPNNIWLFKSTFLSPTSHSSGNPLLERIHPVDVQVYTEYSYPA